MGWISLGCKTILGRLQRGREMFIFRKDDDERRDDFGEVLGSGCCDSREKHRFCSVAVG